MKNRVAIICEYTIFPNRIGGMDHFFVAYDKALKEKGFEVEWFFKDVSLFDYYKKLTIYNAKGNNLESFFINHIYKNENKNYDIIITHFLEQVSIFFRRVKKKLPKSIIYNVDHNPRPLQGYTFKKKLTKKVKGKLYSKYIDGFISVSNYSKENLIKDYGKQIKGKIKIIYNGIDNKKYILRKRKRFIGKFIIACHLRKEKGVQDVLRAIYLLKNEQVEKMTVDVFGDGPYKKELQEMSSIYNLNDIVFFKGNSKSLYNQYHSYDYLIHPSYGETFCYSVIESLISRLPVITTKKEGNVLGQVKNGINGYLFNAKNVHELKSIFELILDNKHQLYINESSYEIEKRFSLSTMVQNHLNLVLCT